MPEGIERIDAIEFSFPEEQFTVLYEQGVWRAQTWEDLGEDDIIIEDEKGSVLMKEDIELFSDYVLTVEHFKKLKEISGER